MSIASNKQGDYPDKLPRSAAGVNVNWSGIEFNYEQTMLFITLSRSTKKTIPFKLRLISELGDVREKLEAKLLEDNNKEIARLNKLKDKVLNLRST